MFQKKYLLLFISVMMGMINCFAQQKQSVSNWQFHSINQLGLLEGQAGGAFQLQTINGFQYKSWFGGIGVGLDDYRLRGIPLFADIRKEFGTTRNRFYVYADAGIHFSWVTNNEKMHYVVSDKFSNGLYTDAGLGYRIRVSRKNTFLLSAGYCFKSMEERVSYYSMVYPGFTGSVIAPVQKYQYQLNRITIKAGWLF